MAYMHTYQAWVSIYKYLLWFVFFIPAVHVTAQIQVALTHFTVTMLNSSWVKTNKDDICKYSSAISMHCTSKHHWWSLAWTCLHLKHLPKIHSSAPLQFINAVHNVLRCKCKECNVACNNHDRSQVLFSIFFTMVKMLWADMFIHSCQSNATK